MLHKRARFGILLLLFGLAMPARPQAVSSQTSSNPVPCEIKRPVTGKLALFNTITVEVEGLSEYLKQSNKDATKFILYLDSRPLKGVSARRIDGTNTLQFDIKRTAESKDQWDALLGRPFAGPKSFTYEVLVSVGYETEAAFPSTVKASLTVVDQTWFWIFVVVFAFALVLFFWLAKVSAIIRDPCKELPVKNRPYSLGRTQMAFWLFLVAVSYVLIWMITSDRDSLTESALGLMGISAATALGAAVVGSSKDNAAKTQGQDLEIEKAALESRLSELEPQIAASPAPSNLDDLNKEKAEKKARLGQVRKEILDLSAAAAPQPSRGFLNDILTDVNGISLHRFQIAIWTVVLGFIFAASVYNSLAMPQLSGTLLALMGISGGTYIAFKFPEKQS